MHDSPASLWFEHALLPQGWASDVRVFVADGHIARIECGVPRAAGEAGGGVAVPGMPNLHSHAFQRGMAGLTEISGGPGDDFWAWRELMYRFLDRASPDDIEAISAFAFMEMLEGGFTRVAEFHYLHTSTDGSAYDDPSELTQRIVAASEAAGLGLTLLPVFYAHATFGGAPPKHGQRRFILSLDAYARLMDVSRGLAASRPDMTLGVAPHSLRAVTPGELAHVVHLAGEGPKHIHAAEQQKEVDDCLAWSGRRPVEWLADNVALGPDWTLIHATQVTAEETALLARSGAVAGLCPVTEANLGDGIFPAIDYVVQGGVFGIGTDSNVEIGVAAELRMLEYSQRLQHRGRNLMADGKGASTGLSLFRRAQAGGAQACGVAAGLAPGTAADVVTLGADGEDFVRSPDQHLDSWLFEGRGVAVRDVWRAGRRVVENGRHARRSEIAARYRKAVARVIG